MAPRGPDCLDEETIASLVAGALDAAALAPTESHLALCPSCRAIVADASRGVEQTLGAGEVRPARAAGDSGAPESSTPRPGDILEGKYRLEAVLGRGGMGEVFAARHLELGHRVAVKILHAGAGDATAKARFLREARTSAVLASDHIPRVFDIGELASGQPYIVLEYLVGEDLAELVARGRVPTAAAVRYVLQACKGLAEVHANGIVHRDLKPANLFLATFPDGRRLIKILDFGLSKPALPTGTALELTSSATLLGSPLYMSPEQILSHAEVDARSDVWALGVVLYELCTGLPPFRPPSFAAALVAIATEAPAAPSALEPALPAELERVILRCLEKDRNARFDSVDELAAALAPFALDADSAPARSDAVPPSLVAPRAAKHNLPAQVTAFVGRERELERLALWLRDPRIRLVTILAPGGMGKSRLAVEVAHALRENAAASDGGAETELFPDGVFFVQLAPIGSAELLPSTIAERVGLRLHPGVESRRQLLDYLRNRRLLLVLDNFEHLLGGASLIGDVLEAAAFTKILVTSRERLGLFGETHFELSGMSVPAREDAYDPLDFSGPKLFVQIAQQLCPGFDLAPTDLPHLARICRLVDGLPLGIVLAASWIETLPLAAIAAEIVESLDFLETDLRDVPARQRSIRAVFDSSWHLLSEEARHAFSRLCIFRGGFTREAAQAVAGAGPRTLAALIRKSLIRRLPESGRYEVHEVLRQYGELRLRDDPSEHGEALDRHARFCAEFLSEREACLKSARSRTALDEIAVELGNVRVAWARLLERRDFASVGDAIESLRLFYSRRASFAEAELAFRAAVAAFDGPESMANGEFRRALGKSLTACAAYVRAGGRYPEAVALLRRALAVLGDDQRPERAQALMEFGGALLWAGHPEEAVVAAEEGVRLYRTTDDAWGIINALDGLGGVYGGYCGGTGDIAKAESAYRESIERQTALGGIVLPSSLTGLGFTQSRQGRYAEGCRLMLEALALMAGSGDVSSQMVCELDLANTYRNLGDYAAAEDYASRCLRRAREVGSWEIETWSHYQLGDIFKEQGLYAEAAAAYERGFARSFAVGDVGRVAVAKLNFGDLALLQGDYARAELELLASLEGFESVGETWGAVLALDNLGYLQCLQGDYATARKTFERSLEAALSGRLYPYAANVVAGLGLLSARLGNGERAVELLSLAQSHPATERHTQIRRIAPLLVELEEQLPASAYSAALARGTALTLESDIVRTVGAP
jgi:serine/threonine protein kinase/predicted ATPase